MRIIHRGRAQGKTCEAIKHSAQTGSYIVCANMKECDRVFRQAGQMGLSIQFPITFSEFIERCYYSAGIKGFVIDNADALLQSLTPVPIRAITMGQIGHWVKDRFKPKEESPQFFIQEIPGEWVGGDS